MRGSKLHNPKQEYIIIDGIYFYKERTGIGYYLGNVPTPNGRKPMRAHQYVWIKHNGEIPKGYHIHHLDGDVSNNDIANLVLMSPSAHSSHHASEHSEESRERMNTIVHQAAVDWHKSEQGSEWHKQHYENVARNIWNEKVTLKCNICGKEYQTTHAKMQSSKFCSNNCRAKARRLSGKDREKRICAICGKEFECNKYSRQKVCGNKECANESQRRVKTGVPRHRKSNF